MAVLVKGHEFVDAKCEQGYGINLEQKLGCHSARY